MLDRRHLIRLFGGTLALPMLESTSGSLFGREVNQTPTRLLVVGNPFGAHPEHFFPQEFGHNFSYPKTISSLSWLNDRLSVLSHTDHGMKSGHGREVAFLSGVLPEDSASFPEKNMSLDQVVARRTSSQTRFPSINVSLERGIRLSWNANGVNIKPFTDVNSLHNRLFENLSSKEKKNRKELLDRNGSILDTISSQFNSLRSKASKKDRERLDLYANSVRELESNLVTRKKWVDRDKPQYDLTSQMSGTEITIENHYHAVFDMVAYAFQTDLTRVATIAFSPELKYTDIKGVTRGYHACTHNGKKEDTVAELVAIEAFQVEQMSRCLKKLDEIPEPNADGSMLDHTVVLFGSGMGYGGTHSNRNLPVLVAGGGFKHVGHVDTRGASGDNMPLCNLFVTLMQRFGIERDSFNTSTGAFEFRNA